MPNTDPAQDSVKAVTSASATGRARQGSARCCPSGLDHRRPDRRAARALRRAALPPACTLFTDDGNGVQDPQLMRHALKYRRQLLGITGPALRGRTTHRGRGDARGLVLQPTRPARLAGDRRGLMLPPTSSWSASPASPMHFLHLVTARVSTSSAAAKADGLPITAEATPHHFSLTDELPRELRRALKVNPPLRTRTTPRRSRPGWPTAPSTPSPPTTRRTRTAHQGGSRSTRRPPGVLGLETTLGVRHAELDVELVHGGRACSAGAGGDRRRRRSSRSPDRRR